MNNTNFDFSNLTQDQAIILAYAEYIEVSYVRHCDVDLTDWKAAQQPTIKKSHE